MPKPKVTRTTIRRRQKIERRIVTRVVTDALKQGYFLAVDDGGETYAITGSTSLLDVMATLLNTDEDYLIISDAQRRVGWVRFVYGNEGWTVICDYSANDATERVIARAEVLGRRIESLCDKQQG